MNRVANEAIILGIEILGLEVGAAMETVSLAPPPRRRRRRVRQNREAFEDLASPRVAQEPLVSLLRRATSGQMKLMASRQLSAQAEQARRPRHDGARRNIGSHDQNARTTECWGRLHATFGALPAKAVVDGGHVDGPGHAREVDDHLIGPQALKGGAELWRLVTDDDDLGLREQSVELLDEQRR
jgi:hypothetical protein